MRLSHTLIVVAAGLAVLWLLDPKLAVRIGR
jgi:hypothetical protein